MSADQIIGKIISLGFFLLILKELIMPTDEQFKILILYYTHSHFTLHSVMQV